MITFPVSDVHPGSALLPPMSLAELLQARAVRSVEAADCNLPGLITSSRHGLLAAVHRAFMSHLPLTLAPDDVWLCIAQGFAAHINAHAEELRERFVQHQGKVKLSVQRDHFVRGAPTNDWPGMFVELSDQIAQHVGRTRDLVVADFSTTGPIERAASEVVLFDALQAYFSYDLETICGIPQITLLGTTDDWRSIRRRAEVLSEFNLTNWTNALLPVLDQFVAAAQGTVDRSFWQSLYKYHSRSGGDVVTGWINTLFPYLKGRAAWPLWNRYATDWAELEIADDMSNVEGMEILASSLLVSGPKLDQFPIGISTAPFTWAYHGEEIAMTFTGGFFGVAQDQATGAVRPVIGWAVGQA